MAERAEIPMIQKISRIFTPVCFYALMSFWVALPFSKALMEIAFGVALTAWVLRFARRSQEQTDRPPAFLLFLLTGYTILSVLSVFWSEFRAVSVRGIFKVLEQVLVCAMTFDLLQEPKRFRRFYKIFAVAFAVILADAVWQYVWGWDFIRFFKAQEADAGRRVVGSFYSYGLLAAYLLMTIPMAFSAVWGRSAEFFSKKVRWGYWGLVLLGGMVLYWTRSRGAFASLGLGVLIFLAGIRRWKWLIAFGIFGLLFVIFAPPNMIIHRNIEAKEQSVVERYYLWDRAIQVIRAKPWTGTGINTYAKAHQKYDKTQNWRVRDYYAHNGYLQMAAETGIPSVVFFLAFLGVLLVHILKTAQAADPADRGLLWGFAVSILNFMIFGAVDTVFHNPQSILMFWFVLGTAGALSVHSRASIFPKGT